MTQRSDENSSSDISGPACMAIVFQALALLGVSGYFIVTGIIEVQNKKAVITHKHAPVSMSLATAP